MVRLHPGIDRRRYTVFRSGKVLVMAEDHTTAVVQFYLDASAGDQPAESMSAGAPRPVSPPIAAFGRSDPKRSVPDSGWGVRHRAALIDSYPESLLEAPGLSRSSFLGRAAVPAFRCISGSFGLNQCFRLAAQDVRFQPVVAGAARTPLRHGPASRHGTDRATPGPCSASGAPPRPSRGADWPGPATAS